MGMNDRMKAVKCPLCGGKPQYVYLAPNKKMQDAYEEQEDGFNPIILFKYIECKQCQARTASVSLSLDEAVADWNDKVKNLHLVIPYGVEDVRDVED